MVKISNKIEMDKTKELLEFCKEYLVIDNPEFFKKQKMNLWIGNTPKTLSLYELRDNKIILPFGALKKVWKFIKEQKVVLDFADKNIKISGHIELYDYQKKAVEHALKAENGVLISPAGSGKTQMAISIIKEIGKKTLWLTHTADLLKQSKERFEYYFNAKVGTITEGKINIQDVTFATVQTMAKMDLNSVKNEFSVIIVDECHRLASTPTKLTMFGKVISSLKARYKFGITATAHRGDGMIKSLFAYLGDVFYEVEKHNVADKTVKAKIKLIYNNLNFDVDSVAFNTDGTINFSEFITALARDNARNKLIANNIMQNKNKFCLVLSDRLEQLKEIKKILGYGTMIDGSMISKKGKQQREKAIEDMRQGKEKVLFASYNLAKEGLDIPRLDCLFLASPKKDLAVIIQSVGRIERKFGENKKPIVYDIVDKTGITINMFKERCRIYKKNNNEVIK